MNLKEKLKALGLEETYNHGQFIKRNLDLYVYVRYNKIDGIQLSKMWKKHDFNNYTEYLNKVNYLLNQIESIIINDNKGE